MSRILPRHKYYGPNYYLFFNTAGELGNGAKSKLVINMMEGSFMASLAEGLSLAEKAGLDQYMLLEILNLGALACPLVSTKGAAILEVSSYSSLPLNYT